MRKTTEALHAKSADEKERTPGDNICKRLAEKYPEQFTRWVFGAIAGKVRIMKTELSREPIRADSAIFLQSANAIFHAEAQTTIKSHVPMPLRMLDYYVGFKRDNPKKRIRQVLIILKDSGEAIPNHFEDENTLHRFTVKKMWEEPPDEILKYDGLLPLATLCRTDSGENLLKRVSARIRKIKSKEQRVEINAWSQMLAGLRYDRSIIHHIFREGAMLEESVIVQDWLQRGEQRGLQKGVQQIIIRQLNHVIGKVPARAYKQLQSLSAAELEDLGEALLDFKTKEDLTRWLSQHKAKRG
jgi:predicted transposase YdaD